MSTIRTILSLLAAGTVMVDSPLPKRLVNKVVHVVAAVVLSAVLVGALLFATTVYVYQLMVTTYGLAPMDAVLYLLVAIALLTAAAVICTTLCVRNLVDAVPRSIKKNIPIASHLGNEVTQVAQAFFRGLTGKTDI